MYPLNIALVVVGAVITIGSALFWHRIKRILQNPINTRFYSDTIVKEDIHMHSFLQWIYRHKSKFDVLMAGVVTIIEFFALIPF